jgi:hypothetical protein
MASCLPMSTALSNSTRAAHSSNSYPSATDIRNTTTKIVGITLTIHRITTDIFSEKKKIEKSASSFNDIHFTITCVNHFDRLRNMQHS